MKLTPYTETEASDITELAPEQISLSLLRQLSFVSEPPATCNIDQAKRCSCDNAVMRMRNASTSDIQYLGSLIFKR